MAGVGGGEIMAELRGAPVVDGAAAAARSTAAGDQRKAAGTRQRKSPSIYQVPAWIRDLNSPAYTPRFVSFGPYHSGAAELRPMEKHKRTARARFLDRAGKNLDELKRIVGDMAADLMGSYDGLDKQWRSDPDGFLDLMVLDGCFMLELLIHGYPDNRGDTTTATPTASEGYAEDNPVFGNKGAYMMPYIRRDMLLLENQLPLQLLERLAQLVPPGVFVPFLRPMISSAAAASLKAGADHDHFGQLNAVARILSHYDRDHDKEREAYFLSVANGQYHWNVQDMALRFLASGKLLLESGPLQMAPPSPAGLLLLLLSFYVRPLIDVLSLVLSPLGRFFLDCQRHLSGLSVRRSSSRGRSRARESEKELLQDLEGIHILDVYKKSMLLHGDSWGGEVPFSAQELSHFGVKLTAGAVAAGSFRGIDFGPGRLATEFHFLLPVPVPRRHLSLPVLKVDNGTLPTLLNLMAFERLHHGTGDEVNNYLLLMCSLVRSVVDVDVLYRRGVVVFGPGHNDGAAYGAFAELAKQVLPTSVDVVPAAPPSRADRPAATACCWPAAAGAVAPRPRGKLYTEVATYCSTRGARTVRWLRLCRPPPFLAILLSMVAMSISLFIALSNHVYRMRR